MNIDTLKAIVGWVHPPFTTSSTNMGVYQDSHTKLLIIMTPDQKAMLSKSLKLFAEVNGMAYIEVAPKPVKFEGFTRLVIPGYDITIEEGDHFGIWKL